MNEGFDIKRQLVEMGQGMLQALIDGVPKVVTIVIVLIVALIALKILRKVATTVLEKVRFDALMASLGVSDVLRSLGVSQPLSSFLPTVIYWLALLMFLQGLADAMDVEVLADAIGAVLGFLPNLLSALLVVVLGLMFGQWAGGTVTRAATENGIEFARPLGNLLTGLIVFVVAMIAITQLKIDTAIVRLVAACVLIALATAFALSFGLGTREFTRDIIAGFYAKKLFAAGDRVEVRGASGTVEAITAVQVVIATDDRTVVLSNSAFLAEAAKRR